MTPHAQAYHLAQLNIARPVAPLDSSQLAGFFSRLDGLAGDPGAASAGPAMLEILERVIESRKVDPPAGSYVAGLLQKGQPQICRKIGEEAAEVMTAALGGEGDARVVSEVADLWFHTMVLLSARGIPLRRVLAELAARHAKGK